MKRGVLGMLGAAVLAAPLIACSSKSDSGDDANMAAMGGAGAGTPSAPSMGNANAGSGTTANAGGAGSGASNAPSTAGSASPSSMGGSGGSSPSNAAAGSEAAPPATESLDPNVDWTALTLVHPKIYSAFDGEHLFQVPVHVDGATVELAGWQAVPADAATFDPDSEGGGVLVTVAKGVEDITIAAHNDSLGGTAVLHVTVATPENWKTGEARYNNGVDYQLPDLNFADLIDPNWVPPATPKNLACNNCHSTGAKYFEIQHTPTQIGNLSDQDLITIFTTGMKPPGVPYHLLPEMLQHLYPEFHTWDASAEEQKGLIVYLRSLTPMGQGDIALPDGGFGAPMM
jgi:hypothetical protein